MNPEQTLRLVDQRDWLIVLLKPREKRPDGPRWNVTRDLKDIARHLRDGGNIGLVCGEESGVDVLDFDQAEAFHEMQGALGVLSPTVITGSGKFHVYVAHDQSQAALPAKMRWRGKIVGECQRGPNQYVVCPPSVHPSGGVYAWADVPEFIPGLPWGLWLPPAWRAHLVKADRPDWLVPGDRRGTEEAVAPEWTGPSAEELLGRALLQPGARRRSHGVKFQCPGCRAEGHDKTRDNALVGLDGRWGCAINPEHKRAIGEALGFSLSAPVEALAETDDDDLVEADDEPLEETDEVLEDEEE